MSLAKLLAVGRSLDMGQNVPGRYRVQHRQVLPRFYATEPIGAPSAGSTSRLRTETQYGCLAQRPTNEEPRKQEATIFNRKNNLFAALAGFLCGKIISLVKTLCNSVKQNTVGRLFNKPSWKLAGQTMNTA